MLLGITGLGEFALAMIGMDVVIYEPVSKIGDNIYQINTGTPSITSGD